MSVHACDCERIIHFVETERKRERERAERKSAWRICRTLSGFVVSYNEYEDLGFECMWLLFLCVYIYIYVWLYSMIHISSYQFQSLVKSSQHITLAYFAEQHSSRNTPTFVLFLQFGNWSENIYDICILMCYY